MYLHPTEGSAQEVPMQIRHLVCTDNFAGVERYLTYVAPELVRRGHGVEVVGGAPAPMRAALAGTGVVHRAATTMAQVARANLRGPRPDVVHAHMTAADAAAALTRPLIRRPVVSTLHFAHGRGHSAATRALYRALRPAITYEVAISRYVADAAGGEVILNGIPDVGPPPDPADRRPVVLMAQRLEAEKRTDVALRAWQRSGLATRGWELHLAGEGAERARLADLARDLGVDASVRFLGRVDDVPERMRRASLFLATADAEPFGLAVVEAMAAALPAVAADAGGHRETIGSATPETLYPPDRPRRRRGGARRAGR